MFGLEFSAAALINAVAGGLIGGAVSLAVAWWSTREIRAGLGKNAERIGENSERLEDNIDVLVTVARGLEEAFQSGRLKFNYDEDNKPEGIVIHLGSGGSNDGMTEGVSASDEVDERVVPEEGLREESD